MQKRILIVDDEPAIRDMVAYALRKGDFDLVPAGDAREAQAADRRTRADLILLDWMLPGTSGLELARRWRREALTRDIPIIMLPPPAARRTTASAGSRPASTTTWSKPFSAREAAGADARGDAPFARDDEDGSVQVSGLRIDGAAHQGVRRRSMAPPAPVQIGPTEYRLLHFLAHPERVYTRSQLLDHVWGGSVYVRNARWTYIRRLRKTLEPHRLDPMVQTVRGAGYRFSAAA